MRTIGAGHAVFALTLAGTLLSSLVGAKAGDIAGPAYGPYPYGGPIERDAICRVFHERRIDGYGRETIHRIRLCDDGPVYAPAWTEAPPAFGYSRRYYEPSAADYYARPRPPAPIGPAYYN
jgi:hypothetical protein